MPRRKRLASRSPGVTPKSSVHRHLAKLGMLGLTRWRRSSQLVGGVLRALCPRTRSGSSRGVQVRRAMAEEKGVGFSELSRILHGLGVAEQSKGQKGLTKFLSKWRADFEDDEELGTPSPGTSSIPHSWSLVASDTPSKPSTPPGLSSGPVQVAEKPGPPLMIGNPTIFGKDRKAGAATTGLGTDTMAVLAQAIQSQTAELASLVRRSPSRPPILKEQ